MIDGDLYHDNQVHPAWDQGHRPLDQAGGDLLEAPDDEAATAAILHLGAMGNVHTSTCRAFTAAEMEKIVAKAHGD
jgi:hypothetical protein